MLLATLWDGIVHISLYVRCNTAKLFEVCFFLDLSVKLPNSDNIFLLIFCIDYKVLVRYLGSVLDRFFYRPILA